MQVFRDKINQEWIFSLDLADLHDITNGGIDFSNVGADDLNLIAPTEKTLELIMFNPMVSLPIIWFCVKDQLDGKFGLQKTTKDSGETLTWKDPVTNQKFQKILFSESNSPDIDFYRLFSQEIISEVSTLLLHEVTDFFPMLKICISKLIQTFLKLQTIAPRVLADEEILTDEELEKILRKGLMETKRELIGSGD